MGCCEDKLELPQDKGIAPLDHKSPPREKECNTKSLNVAQSVLTCLNYTQEFSGYFTRLQEDGTSSLEGALKRFYLAFQNTSNAEELICKILENLSNEIAISAGSFLKDILSKLKQRGDLIEQVFAITTEEVIVCTVCHGMSTKKMKQEIMDLTIIAKELYDDIEYFNEKTYYDASSALLGLDIGQQEVFKSALLDQFARRKHIPLNNSSYSLHNSLKYKLGVNICENDPLLLCKHCCRYQTHLNQIFIRSLCPVFVCYFERFHISIPGVPINIPEKLDMSAYASNGGMYELLAVVNHRGSESCGHYTSMVRVDRVWRAFDGTTAKDGEHPEFSRSTEGIIAFYHRRD